METVVTFHSLKGLSVKGSKKWACKGKTFLIKVLQCVYTLMGMTQQRGEN